MNQVQAEQYQETNNEIVQFTDSHCHLSVLTQLERVPENYKIKLVMCSISADDFTQMCNLEDTISNNVQIIGRGFGIHPHYAKTFTKSVLEEIEEKLNIVKDSFIGEIGLEQRQQYVQNNPMEVQLNCFKELLELCFKYNKIGSIHLVSRKCEGYQNAHQLFINILKELKQKYLNTKPLLVLHAYSGSYETFKQIIQLYSNIFLGVGHLNYNTKHIQRIMTDEVLKSKIVFETDFYDPETQQYAKLCEVYKNIKVTNRDIEYALNYT